MQGLKFRELFLSNLVNVVRKIAVNHSIARPLLEGLTVQGVGRGFLSPVLNFSVKQVQSKFTVLKILNDIHTTLHNYSDEMGLIS